MSIDSHSPLVDVRSISFAWHGADVLIDVSLEVHVGDFLAIIGPNGSGKSTLIKIMLGLLRPTKGEVRLLGESPTRFQKWTQIGYVAQKVTHIDPFFPVSVQEVLAMGLLAGRRIPAFLTRADSMAIDETLERVGVSHLTKRMIGELSGGEQQRVFIARAIVNNPAIIILDEPTTGIDSGAREQFYNMLNTLTDHNMAVVLVTHDIGVVTRHVKKLACLNQRLYFHGTHEEFCQCDRLLYPFAVGNHLIDHTH